MDCGRNSLRNGRRKERGTSLVRIIHGLLVLLALALYQGALAAGANPLFFQPIPRIWARLVEGFASGLLWRQLGISVAEVGVSFLLAVVVGLTVGFLVGRSHLLTEAFEPVFYALYSVPLFILYPVFVVWLGLDISSKIAFASVYAFFPITINAIAGFKSVDENLIALSRSMGGTPWQILWKVQIPAAIPSMFAGFRTGLSLALIGVVATEFLVSLRGIGYELQSASTRFDTAGMYGITLLVVLLGLIVNGSLDRVDLRLRRWKG
jgi:NitT/TauT family transport system permease protein